MTPDLTRAEIERLSGDFDRGRDLGYSDQRSLLRYALSEPTRLAAARAEGVREGIERAARYAWNWNINKLVLPHAFARDGLSDAYWAGAVDASNSIENGLCSLAPAPAEAPKPLTRCQAASLRNDGECSHPLCPVPRGSRGVARLVCTLPGAGDDYVDEDDLPMAEASAPVAEGNPADELIARVLDAHLAWASRPEPKPSKALAVATAREHLRSISSALEAEVAALREGLGKAAAQFEFYRDQRMAKGTDDGRQKAKTNEQMAAMCRALLQGQEVTP